MNPFALHRFTHLKTQGVILAFCTTLRGTFPKCIVVRQPNFLFKPAVDFRTISLSTHLIFKGAVDFRTVSLWAHLLLWTSELHHCKLFLSLRVLWTSEVHHCKLISSLRLLDIHRSGVGFLTLTSLFGCDFRYPPKWCQLYTALFGSDFGYPPTWCRFTVVVWRLGCEKQKRPE